MSNLTLIKTYISLKINEKRSRKSILNLREKKFRKMLKYAYNNSNFYKRFYSSRGIKEEDLDNTKIDELPVIDKDILMDNFDEVITTNAVTKKGVLDFLEKSKDPNELFKGKYHVIHTSGTSAKLGIFVYSKKDWDSFFPYVTKAINFRFSKSKSACITAGGGHYVVLSSSAWLEKGLMRFFCKSKTFDIKKPIDTHIKNLNEFQPDILAGYFNGLKILAEEQESKELAINPKVLVNCGEAIVPKDKEKIEQIFKAPMVNGYGMAECISLGMGKKEYGGIILYDDIAYVEIKDDHILLTNLFNKTMPIIRYKINDTLFLKKQITNKIPFTLVENIVGRTEHMIWFENNKGKMDFIHPLIIHDFYVKGVDKVQMIIKDKSSFDFKVVITEEDKKKVINKIKKELDDLLNKKNFTNVKYSIIIADKIDIDKKTGKNKLIVFKEK